MADASPVFSSNQQLRASIRPSSSGTGGPETPPNSCPKRSCTLALEFVPHSFASKVGRQRGMRSVPPRGSGWVQPVAFENLANSHADHQPTRYRVVVLTSCHVDDRVLRQSSVVAHFQLRPNYIQRVRRRSTLCSGTASHAPPGRG